MKYEWKKKEKTIYLPKSEPQVIEIPNFKFFMISGKGNPNEPFFGEYIQALYALSYAIRMSYKGGYAPENYYEYTVYPLEGLWDLTEAAKQKEDYTFSKDDLVFTLMIRQPDFVTEAFANEAMERTRKKKPLPLLEEVQFVELEEGKCIQMLHMGSYDSEPETFAIMEKFCEDNQLTRMDKRHREIYLSDFRKVAEDKLKTVLRFQVK